ncbi:hypothetical protein C8J56DRAFT_936017 [Mycena floridula]|nr:hypothetical protein C8J56DRAFT_936017 [Mycena floridula]
MSCYSTGRDALVTSKSSLEHLQPSFSIPAILIMQFKLSAITLALATLAIATPDCPHQQGGQSDASSPGMSNILGGLAGINLSSITGLVGVGCSPITVIGVGNGACSTTTVNCQDNSHSEISLGCIPVTL